MTLEQDKQKTLDYLINKVGTSHPELRMPKCCFFLGAGCSISSDIPLSGKIIELCQRFSFIDNSKDGFTIDKFNDHQAVDKFISDRQSEFDEFKRTKEEEITAKVERNRNELINTILSRLKQDKTNTEIWNNFKPHFINDARYGHWFEVYNENPGERQKLIEWIIEDKKPKGAYILLSYLIAQGNIKNIFTTNFDDLIYDALLQCAEKKARVYAHNEIANYINIHSSKPNIIKLHGDFLFEDIKNTTKETSTLPDNMELKLSEALTKLDLVVVGYNGADYSVMKALQEIKDKTHFGLYWCGLDSKNLHWRVADFINNTNNSYFIEIEEFDSLVNHLWGTFGTEIPQIVEAAIEREEEVNRFLQEVKEESEKDQTLTTKQRERISSSIEVRLTDKSFYEVHSMPDYNSKKEYFKKLRIDGVSRILKNIHSNLDRQEAESLFENLDNESFFQDKIKTAPIQHISNALSNLKVIDRARTKEIYTTVPNNVFIEKLKAGNPGERRSAFGELYNINQNKTTEIAKEVNTKIPEITEETSLRSIANNFTEANRHNSNEAFEAIKDEELIKRFESEPIQEIVNALIQFYGVSKNRTVKLYGKLNNQLLLDKLSKCSFQATCNALSILSNIQTHKTVAVLRSINQNSLNVKMLKVGLAPMTNGLLKIHSLDKRIARSLLFGITDSIIVEKVMKCSEFSKIAAALHEIDCIDTKKANYILNKIPNKVLAKKLNEQNPQYEALGVAFDYLLKINSQKTSDIVKASTIKSEADSIAKGIKKTRYQAFLHYFPFFFEADFDLACDIVGYTDRKFLSDLYQWKSLDKFTITLVSLLKVFEKIGVQDYTLALSEFILYNIDRLRKTYSQAEIERIKQRLKNNIEQ